MKSDIDLVSEIGIKYGIMRSHFNKGKPDTALTREQVGKIMDTRYPVAWDRATGVGNFQCLTLKANRLETPLIPSDCRR